MVFFFFHSTAQLQYVEDSRAGNEVNVSIGKQCKKQRCKCRKKRIKGGFNLGSSW